MGEINDVKGIGDVIKSILEKKVERYSCDQKAKNFSIPSEITVTITLEEYRDLVTKVAKTDYEMEKIKNDYWAEKTKKEELQKEAEQLRIKLSNLIIANDDDDDDDDEVRA